MSTGTTTKPSALKNIPPPTLFARLVAEGVLTDPPWLMAQRRSGIDRFLELGYPTVQHEDWRFTHIAPVTDLPFHPVIYPLDHGIEDIQPFLIPNLEGPRLVFVDGHLVPGLGNAPAETGVRVRGMAQTLATGGTEIQNLLGRMARQEPDAFVSLNTAFHRDGAWVEVDAPGGSTPIQLIYVNTGSLAGLTVHVRNLVHFAPRSRGTIVECHVFAGQAQSVTNVVTEVFLDEEAECEHITLQDVSPQGFHFASFFAELATGASHRMHSIAMGAKLSRTMIRAALADDVEATLNGLYLAADEQLIDHHMVVEHLKPRSRSHEYFNGIVSGQGRGVFHGRIRVHPGAQQTDAKQTNKNLLMSDTAVVHSKPQLEIYADDVKCTHGATTGPLNEQAVFYLRTRGLGVDQARRLLLRGFTTEILDRVECAPARVHLENLVQGRLAREMGPP